MDLNFIRNLPQNATRGYRWLGLISLLVGLFVWYLAARFQRLARLYPAFSYAGLAALLIVAVRWGTGPKYPRYPHGNPAWFVFRFAGRHCLGLSARQVAHPREDFVALSRRQSGRASGRHCASAGHLVWTRYVFQVLICGLIVFFPVLVNTVVGLRAVPGALYDLMHSLRASCGPDFASP